MKTYKKLLSFEGILLSIVGPAHIIYLLFFIGASTIETALYYGVIGIGILYTLFGISFLFRKKALLIPALIINALGLTGVLIMQEASPLWAIDPYLIAVDVVSVPMLAYLNFSSNKKKL